MLHRTGYGNTAAVLAGPRSLKLAHHVRCARYGTRGQRLGHGQSQNERVRSGQMRPPSRHGAAAAEGRLSRVKGFVPHHKAGRWQ